MKTLSLAMVAGVAFLYSCTKSNESINSTDSQTANSESVSASTSSESSDLGNSVISNVTDAQLSSARASSVITGLEMNDRRLTGATITIVGTSTANGPSGTVKIDYGAGVTTDGVTRKGQIIIVYQGRRFHPGSTRSITFNNFYRNAVQVSGSYNVTITDSTKTSAGDIIITFTHSTNLTLTFGDGTTITRISNWTVVWDYNSNNPSQSTVTHKAGGSASGTTRLGKDYTMSITKDIVYRADCWLAGFHLPVSGTKTITVFTTTGTLPRVYTIDYGTTTCDNTITVTVNGKTYTITVRADGN